MSSVSKVGGDSVNNQLQRIISLVFLLSKPWVIDDGAPVLTWVGKIVLEKGMVLVRREGGVRVRGQEKTRWGRAVGVSGKGRVVCGVVGGYRYACYRTKLTARIAVRKGVGNVIVFEGRNLVVVLCFCSVNIMLLLRGAHITNPGNVVFIVYRGVIACILSWRNPTE